MNTMTILRPIPAEGKGTRFELFLISLQRIHLSTKKLLGPFLLDFDPLKECRKNLNKFHCPLSLFVDFDSLEES